jgi:hypothetical protein
MEARDKNTLGSMTQVVPMTDVRTRHSHTVNSCKQVFNRNVCIAALFLLVVVAGTYGAAQTTSGTKSRNRKHRSHINQCWYLGHASHDYQPIRVLPVRQRSTRRLQHFGN